MRAHRVLKDGVLLRKEVGGGGYTYHSTTSSVHRETQPFCCTLLHTLAARMGLMILCTMQLLPR